MHGGNPIDSFYFGLLGLQFSLAYFFPGRLTQTCSRCLGFMDCTLQVRFHMTITPELIYRKLRGLIVLVI